MKTATQNSARDARENPDQIRSEMRKRWLYILPAVFITYSLAYVDRTNYGFGAAAGLAQTLHISGSRSALLGAQASGQAERWKAFADSCMAEYDLDGWTVQDLVNPDDVSVLG